MSISEQFWIAVFLVLVVGVIISHIADRRRQRSIVESEARRRARKAEVERAARKAL